mgnify:CR=1 FL=1
MLKNNKIKILLSAHNRNRIFVYIWTNCLHERWISNETECKFF